MAWLSLLSQHHWFIGPRHLFLFGLAVVHGETSISSRICWILSNFSGGGGNRCLVVEKYFGKAVFDEREQLGYILVKALPQSTGRWHLLYTHWAPEPVIMLVIVNGIEVTRPLGQQTGRFWVSQKALKRWKSGPGDLTWKALVWAFHVDFLALNLRIQALDSGWFSASW